MKQYQRFIFDSYEFIPEKGEIRLRYGLDDELKFDEVLQLPVFENQKNEKNLYCPHFSANAENHALLDRALFYLHLIGGISYYKTCLPREMVIRSGRLGADEVPFWNELYEQGLGEFFYRNDIDFRGLIDFPWIGVVGDDIRRGRRAEPPVGNDKKAALDDGIRHDYHGKILLPLGGGKDSLVSAALLQYCEFDFDFFTLGDHEIFQKTTEMFGKKRIVVERQLAPELFRLNKEGALNGHVPISAYIAFLSVVISILYEYKYIILSNERSASDGNVKFYGKNINHQYSKSFAFECAFSEYIARFLMPSVRYFSLLRPFSELKIAEMFAERFFVKGAYKTLLNPPLSRGEVEGRAFSSRGNEQRDLSFFTSCNRNFRIQENRLLQDRLDKNAPWCCRCPKCAFVFTMLAPFIEKRRLLRIFGENLFANARLLPVFQELLGEKDNKPFDCVGTAEEVRLALYLASEKKEFCDDAVMKYFDAKVKLKIKDVEALKKRVFSVSEEHNVPSVFRKILRFAHDDNRIVVTS